ncbi:MAG TPA: hybrid sensor histidine kinase/response regulator, partial [bacterium]|nr:hybrid sensor histidine kinase/response regulator [bacterium]
ILLDVGMPRQDGFDVFGQIKAMPQHRETPVIFLSAFKETESVLRAFEMGAVDYLTKPILSPILVARIRSILQHQDLQNELRQRNEELEDSNRLKDEMLSICSHDLRSPLTAIDLICQFLQDSLAGKSGHAPKTLINRIINQSRLARRLVDNLLDLNRIEEGRLVPTPSFFNMRELLAACAEDEMPVLQAREVRLEQQLPPESCLCFGDREMIAQVVRNVLGNAIKFARTRVELVCQVLEPEAGERSTLLVTVRDDGPGIGAEQLPTIYNKFQKGDHQSVGSGLGLFIARKLLEMHGGRVEAQSTPGKGTMLLLTIPNAFTASLLPDLAPHHAARVLILSTSKVNGQVLESMLVEAGLLHVDLAGVDDGTGRPAAPPDVLVVDAMEADRDLLAALAQALPAGLACPRVVLGNAQEAAALPCTLQEGMVRLEPPLNPLTYLRAVEQALAPLAAPDAGPAPVSGGAMGQEHGR